MAPSGSTTRRAEQGSSAEPMIFVRSPLTEGFRKATGIEAEGAAQPTQALVACIQRSTRREDCNSLPEVLPHPFPGPEWVALGLAIIAAVVAGSLATVLVAALRKTAIPFQVGFLARHPAISRPPRIESEGQSARPRTPTRLF